MRTVVESLTVHADLADAIFTESCRAFGVRSPLHARSVERTRREYAAADLIRVSSERTRRTFLERGVPAERLVVAYPPFDLAAFPVARFAHDRFRVAFVGALEPWKGFQVLVQAFESLADPRSELCLWGGSGSRPVARYLNAHAGPERRVIVQAVDVRAFGYDRVYGEASVLVHPSLTDGFGLVVGEAMACGLPVVVTDRTGAADLVVEGVNGYVVPAGDADAIRDRLAHLAANPALVRSMGAAAREAMRAWTLERFRASLVPPLLALVS
jgi:glycosyltransferase involved in cell wall biosynthesis